MISALFKTKHTACDRAMDNLLQTLEANHISTFKQQIFHLQNDEIYAIELLNRPEKSSGFSTPDKFYSFAASHGKMAEVDLHMIQLGLERIVNAQLDDKPTYLFMNIHLSTLFTSQWESVFRHLQTVNHITFVLELSEREGLGKYTPSTVEAKMNELRSAGFKIAVDDLGVGYSGLHTLSMVKPDFVKIDRQLISHIDEDRYRQHMMKALVDYWLKENVQIVAEGVERQEEFHYMQNIGVQFVQGYFLHKPEPVLI